MTKKIITVQQLKKNNKKWNEREKGGRVSVEEKGIKEAHEYLKSNHSGEGLN